MSTPNWNSLTGTTGNEHRTVTFYSARTSPFTQKVSVPTNNDTNGMQKSEVLYYLDVISSNLSTLASNQLVPWEYLSTATMFYNVQKSGLFTRNNCGVGYTGGSAYYIVIVGTYYNTTSQVSVDALAQADVDANGQAWVNDGGAICISRPTAWRGTSPYCIQQLFYNVEMSASFIHSCPSGYYGNSLTYTVPANTYSSTTSQAAANALAQADIDANGQSTVDNDTENGFCTMNTSSLYIGMPYQGGFIVYLDNTGLHGLIAATTFLTLNSYNTRPAGRYRWFNGNNRSSISTSTLYGTGSGNTVNIITALGNSAEAARNCGEYSYGGYTDWYLPSESEAISILQWVLLGTNVPNLYNLYLIFNSMGDTLLVDWPRLWTSSQYSAVYAYSLLIVDSLIYEFIQDDYRQNVVIPVRSF